MPSSACRHYRTARQAVHHSPHCPGSHCYCRPDPANDGPPWLMPCRDCKGPSIAPRSSIPAQNKSADVEASGKIVAEGFSCRRVLEAEPEHQVCNAFQTAIPATYPPRLETALQNGAGLWGQRSGVFTSDLSL